MEQNKDQSNAAVRGESLAVVLKEARAFIEANSGEVGYGFHRPANPHEFHPDAEMCSAEEIAAHKVACEEYDKGEFKQDQDSGWIGPRLHMLTAPWGIGSYAYRSEEAEGMLAKIDTALSARAADAPAEPSEPDGLPPLPEPIEVGGEGWDFDDFKSEKTFSCEHMWAYARAAIKGKLSESAELYAPIYFVRMTKTDGWREASEAAYWTFSEVNRRILFKSRAADALDSQPTDFDMLRRKAAAYDEWIAKTEWVQDQSSSFPIGSSLGYHRADVMRMEIERLRAATKSTSYTREEVQQWRDDVAHAAADIVQRAMPSFGDGDWSWLPNQIRSLAQTQASSQPTGDKGADHAA